MQFLFFLFYISVAVAIYLLVCQIFHIPTFATTKVVMNILQNGKKRVIQYDAIVFYFSSKLSKIIRLSDDRKKNMTETLRSAEIAMKPETFISRAIVRALFKFLLIIPFSFTIPIMNLFIVAWAVVGLFNDLKEPSIELNRKVEKIEKELPRFVSTVAQELNTSHDVLGMLENYKPSAGEAFRKELEITIADMNSGDPEIALNRLSTRVRSVMMSETVQGLQAAMRGDNGALHFAMLAKDFKQQQLQSLKMIAIKRPDKMKIFNYALLGCFFITLVTVIGIYLFNMLQGISSR